MSGLVTAVLLAATLLAAGAPSARGQKPLVIQSQNLLRFGHGSKTATKCAALDTVATAVDVILIQELMTQAYPCTAVPAGFAWRSYGPRGATSYKEWYGFLIRTTARDSGPTITIPAVNRTATGTYARPPEAVLLNVQTFGDTTTRRIWLGNIHSTWGKLGVAPRRAEATAAAGFLTSLRNSPVGTQPTPARGYAVIIAGDWNLEAQNATGVVDAGFTAMYAAGGRVVPNVATSLTRAGVQSSPYDHFAYTDTSLVLSTVAVYPAANWATWRSFVSDHLGVRANVTFRP